MSFAGLKLPAHDGASNLYTGSLTSFTGGVNLNFTEAAATTRKWIGLTIGPKVSSGGGAQGGKGGRGQGVGGGGGKKTQPGGASSNYYGGI